jgi:hypothetical protein
MCRHLHAGRKLKQTEVEQSKDESTAERTNNRDLKNIDGKAGVRDVTETANKTDEVYHHINKT